MFIKNIFAIVCSLSLLFYTTVAYSSPNTINTKIDRFSQIIAIQHLSRMQFECHQKNTSWCQNISNPSKTEEFLSAIQNIVSAKIPLEFTQEQINTVTTFFERAYYTPLIHNTSPKFTTFIMLNEMFEDISEQDLLEILDSDTERLKEYYLANDFARTSTGKKFTHFYFNDKLFILVKQNLKKPNR